MVIPRSFSSFALSIWSKGVNGLTSGILSCSTLVIAAVSVVLPWSMCPMVPMLTCGLVRWNLAFATVSPRWFCDPPAAGGLVGAECSLVLARLGRDVLGHGGRALVGRI